MTALNVPPTAAVPVTEGASVLVSVPAATAVVWLEVELVGV